LSESALKLLSDIRQCRLCEKQFAHQPNPIIQLNSQARILIIGQAPGLKAHQSDQPWNDPSGDKLRDWLGVSRDMFYNESLFAHLPMALCFPGYKNGADAPPPKICEKTWHKPALQLLKPQLTLIIGRYAQQHYLPEYPSLTEAIQASSILASSKEQNTQKLQKSQFTLPHPSGRNNRWLAKHPWFETETLPTIKNAVARVLNAANCG